MEAAKSPENRLLTLRQNSLFLRVSPGLMGMREGTMEEMRIELRGAGEIESHSDMTIVRKSSPISADDFPIRRLKEGR